VIISSLKYLPEMHLWIRKSPSNFGNHPRLDPDLRHILILKNSLTLQDKTFGSDPFCRRSALCSSVRV